MTNVVAIANRALSLLGDSATVSSIDPPEGSVQAERVAQFYPDSRDAVLEDAAWTFATTEEDLALTTFASAGFEYAYFVPEDTLKFRGLAYPADYGGAVGRAVARVPFKMLVNEAGRPILLANLPNARGWVTKRITNPSRFSRTFVDALVFHLASMLAGPILKGQAGRRAALDMRNFYREALSKAEVLDLNQDNMPLDFQPRGMQARGVNFGRGVVLDPYWETPLSG